MRTLLSTAPVLRAGQDPLPHEGLFNRSTRVFLLLTALFALAVCGGSLLPQASALHVPGYLVALLGKYLTYALLALSVDLIWGYMGVLRLGHGAFFALGGYAFGMYLMRQIGARGVYGNPDLPDFMVFLNWKELPWFWTGSEHFWAAALLVALLPGVTAYVFGRLAFGSRVSGVYFSIMSQAMTYALMLAFFRNEMGFGGNNGLTDFKSLLGFDIQTDGMRTALFACSALALMAGYCLCRAVTASRLGRVCVAIRDAEDRTRFLGYRVERFQVAVFTLSAVLAGVGGALYVPQVGIINPGEFSPLNSIEVVVWVALGGRGRLYGAVLGAIAVNAFKTWFTGVLPEVWLFALGGLFVLVTVFLPQGLAGLPAQLRAWLRRQRPSAPSEAATQGGAA